MRKSLHPEDVRTPQTRSTMEFQCDIFILKIIVEFGGTIVTPVRLYPYVCIHLVALLTFLP